MLTIFSTCKAFVDEPVHIAQMNALQSWRRLDPKPEIILFGDDKGVIDAAEAVGAILVPQIPKHDCGSIFVNSMWARAQELAHTDLMAYINSDIVLGQNFMTGLQFADQAFPSQPFLMIGHRTNLELDEYLVFNDGWWDRLQAAIAERGSQHSASGKDYFVFRKPQYLDMPPFIVTSIEWDNWVVWDSLQRDLPVIDATDHIKIIHQDHWRKKRGGKQTIYNRSFFVGAALPTYVTSATWTMNEKGIVTRC